MEPADAWDGLKLVFRAPDRQLSRRRLLQASLPIAAAYLVGRHLQGPTNLANAEGSDGLPPPFNRAGAVAYSDEWWNKRNDLFHSFGNDCANFVSQAWNVGGGLPMRDYPSPHWYNRKVPSSPPPVLPGTDHFGWTPSWSVVADFADQMINQYRVAVELPATFGNAWNVAALGDVIQYDFGTGDGWSHASLEVGWAPDYTYEGTAYTGDYMNQHTTDRYHAPWNIGWIQQSDPDIRLRMRARIIHFSAITC